MSDRSSQMPSPEMSKGHWVIDGTGWSFQAVLFDTTKNRLKNKIFNPANVCMFEYTNQWNSLVLSGQLVYKDIERDLGKFFRMPHLLLRVEWAENLAEKKNMTREDGESSGDYWVEKPIKKEDYFNHVFLVNKMEIISHDTVTDVITYRFELISASWYKLSSLCQYSNYNLKKPEPITDIICRLLINAVGLDKVATKTFKESPCRSDINIYYTTTQGDNYFTAINYLLNRMYMEPSSFDVDNHPRIILWDEKENLYRMAKINDDTTCLRVKHNFIQLNRFYQISDTEVNPFAPGGGQAHAMKETITSLSKMSYTRFVKDFYTRHYWDTNITKDKFVRRIIMNQKIQNTFKSPGVDPNMDIAYYPDPDITSKDDNPDLQTFLMDDKTMYLIDESKWSNQRHLYNDCIQQLVNRDTFILTRTNKVCHQPWQCFFLLKDKESMKEQEVMDTDNLKIGKIDEEDKSTIKPRTVPNKYSDNQFFGPWYSSKVTHTIIINGTSKDAVPNMYERIQFVRPFEITPIPKEIKK